MSGNQADVVTRVSASLQTSRTQKKLAEGSQLDWFTTLVTTQAEFTQRLGVIFLTAAREQLK